MLQLKGTGKEFVTRTLIAQTLRTTISKEPHETKKPLYSKQSVLYSNHEW